MKLQTNHIKEYLINLILFIPVINGNLSEILNAFGYSTITAFVYVIVYFLVIIAIYKSLVEKPLFTIFGLLVIFTVVLLTYSFYPQNTSYIIFDFQNIFDFAKSEIMVFLTLSLPIFLLFRTRINITVLFKISVILSVINLLFFVFAFLIINFIFRLPFNYMTIAYGAILSIFLVHHKISYTNKESIIFLRLLEMISIVFIIIGGSRGSLVTLVVFLMGHYFLIERKKTKFFYLKSLLMVCFAFMLLINIENILIFVSDAINSFGYSSRIIDSFFTLEKGILDYSSRENITRILIENLSFFGHGLFGDRLLTGGQYAHNWILEIVTHYGTGLGIVLISTIMYTIVYLLLCCKENKLNRFYALTVIVFLFTKYLVSATYLSNQEFWYLLGLIMNIFIYKKTRQESL